MSVDENFIKILVKIFVVFPLPRLETIMAAMQAIMRKRFFHDRGGDQKGRLG
jgi:hypothetical protein